MALTTVKVVRLLRLVLMKGHEDIRTTLGAGSAEKIDRSVITDLEVLKNIQLSLLSLVRNTLRSGVNLLLTLLTNTTETKHQVNSGRLLGVVVRKGAAILELFTSEDQTLLVRRNTFLVADLAFDSLDGVIRLNLEGNSLSRQRLYENLHFH